MPNGGGNPRGLDGQRSKAVLLTSDEQDLVVSLGAIAVAFLKIAGTDVPADMTEVVDKIHQLQSVVLAQAAARLYPDKFRLLGRTFPND